MYTSREKARKRKFFFETNPSDISFQGKFTDKQLTRAKTQLICEYLREMEVRPTMFEAFARETQVYGHPIGPTEQCKSIEAVKKADIIKLCRNLLASKPAIALLGKLQPS